MSLRNYKSYSHAPKTHSWFCTPGYKKNETEVKLNKVFTTEKDIATNIAVSKLRGGIWNKNLLRLCRKSLHEQNALKSRYFRNRHQAVI